MASLDSICVAVSEAMAAGMANLRVELKTDLQYFRSVICEDMRKQMDKFTAGVHQKLADTTRQVGEAGERKTYGGKHGRKGAMGY